MKNLRLAQELLRSLHQSGVREVVICAGARNAPLVQVLSGDSPFTKFSFFEERSAAFFALGRILDSGRPVAVLTTSGTAAAELLPATIEADYQGLPLILVTADRPKSYRGRGSPQAIIQPGLFSHYVEKDWDIEGELPALELARQRPSHINICFDEPLLEGDVTAWSAAPSEFASPQSQPQKEPIEISARAPLVIVGSLSNPQSRWALPWLKRWQRPLFIEGPSQLRGHPELEPWALKSGEGAVKQLDFDGVIRIGGVPTLRFWRDLETSRLPVWNFSSQPFPGLARECAHFPLEHLEAVRASFEIGPESERQRDRDRATKMEELLKKYPLSEPAWMRWLSEQIAPQSRVYLGNSLPIREWDLAATRKSMFEIFANRGVNGIDGQLSTFFGVAHAERPNWCILGDLTALYDLTGPWALRVRPVQNAQVVVINNGGGKIFERIFGNSLFENPHDLHFGDWAKMWSLNYRVLNEPKPFSSNVSVGFTEILPSLEQTRKFWEEWSR